MNKKKTEETRNSEEWEEYEKEEKKKNEGGEKDKDIYGKSRGEKPQHEQMTPKLVPHSARFSLVLSTSKAKERLRIASDNGNNEMGYNGDGNNETGTAGTE
ncbi:hypothetical protein M8J77_021870 [Diaphorina citri]|nr:hypothetical protein M8J77_021870 [Diaphorina citri]